MKTKDKVSHVLFKVLMVYFLAKLFLPNEKMAMGVFLAFVGGWLAILSIKELMPLLKGLRRD